LGLLDAQSAVYASQISGWASFQGWHLVIEGLQRISRAQFEQNPHEKERDPEFMGDIAPLLNAVITYDPAGAIGLVKQKLIERIPGDPWRGSNPT
jgi:hypothetical protein